MLLEQPAQLTPADAQLLGEGLDAGLALVERPLGDHLQRAAHGIRGAAPEGEFGRDLRPAAQAGAEARLLGRGGGGVVAAVLELGRAGGTDRPAVDSGRGHAHEDAAVEAGVVAPEGLIAGLAVE